MLLRRGSWLETWANLKRAHKDRRARKQVLLFGLLLVIPFVCLFYLAWFVGSGAVFLVPFVLPVIWWRSRREKQDEQALHIVAPQEHAVPQLSDEERMAMRNYLAELTLLCSVLVARAGSEAYLKTKELPEGVEVTSRRIQLELLRTKGLWEKISRPDRELLMIADGHWDWSQIDAAIVAIESLRPLRWILRIDFFLPVIGHNLKVDYRMANELIDDPQKVFKGTELADPGMVRIGRDAVENFLARCLAEGISKGYWNTENEETIRWANEVSQRLGGKQHEDLVLDGSLVSEVTRERLVWATSLSRRRLDVLEWALKLLESPWNSEESFPSLS
jgi:hypothetical protein